MPGDNLLPVYHNPSSATSSAQGSSAMAAAKALAGEMVESGKALVARQRPWSEVLDRSCFAKPDSMADAATRLKQNLSYFRVNYMLFSAAVLFMSLLWHPGPLIILLVLAAAWFYLFFSRTEPLVLFNRSFSEKEVLIILGVITFVAIFMTSTGSTILGALAMAAGIIAVHATFRTPDDLFLEDPDSVARNQQGFQVRHG